MVFLIYFVQGIIVQTIRQQTMRGTVLLPMKTSNSGQTWIIESQTSGENL